MESQISGGLTSSKSYQLYLLCQAYSQLKKYNKLFTCLDEWEKHLAKGEAPLLGCVSNMPLPH